MDLRDASASKNDDISVGFFRNKKVKVKANIIRGCLTQGSLAMAAPLRGEGSQDLLLRYKRASQGYNAN